jgi:hypothetical protein
MSLDLARTAKLEEAPAQISLFVFVSRCVSSPLVFDDTRIIAVSYQRVHTISKVRETASEKSLDAANGAGGFRL